MSRIEKVILIVYSLLGLGVSYWLLSSYTSGDQVAYRLLYSALENARFDEVMGLSRRIVSGSEPIPAYLLWFGSQLGIQKDVYISLFNVGLLLLLWIFLQRNRVSWIGSALILSNFYVLVLLTGAERLKFSYIFFLLASLVDGRLSRVFLLFAPFSHLQSIVMIASLWLAGMRRDVVRVFMRGRLSYSWAGSIGTLFLGCGILAYFLLDSLFEKSSGYVAAYEFTVFDSAQLLILSCIALYATRERLRMMFALAPFYPLIYALGGMRVNMIAVSVVLYLLILERRLTSLPVMLMLAYLSLKSIPFLLAVIEYGDGFSGRLF